MRLVHERQRTWAWWSIFLFAVIVIVAYVFFDMLDVDGSQMTGWPADDMVAAEPFHGQTERLLHAESVIAQTLHPPVISTAFMLASSAPASRRWRAGRWQVPPPSSSAPMSSSPSATDPA